jgi:hypothetical protein
MRTVLLLLCSLLLPASARAQSVVGRIVNEAAEPVLEADVVMADGSGAEVGRATTDSAGVFRVHAPQPGRVYLRVSRLGFMAYTSGPMDLGPVETITVEIRLGTTAVPLDPITVTARHSDPRLAAFHQRRLRRAGGRFITRAEIDRGGQSRTTDVLRGVPGLSIVPVRTRGGAGFTANLVSIRGGGRFCDPAIYIDGMRARQTPQSTMDDILNPASIEGIEIYTTTGLAPAEYSGQGGCGVILFWTRSGDGSEGTRIGWRRALAVAGAAAALFLIIR